MQPAVTDERGGELREEPELRENWKRSWLSAVWTQTQQILVQVLQGVTGAVRTGRDVDPFHYSSC